MFGLRFATDAHARWKNGQPAQSTTGVAKANCTQIASLAGSNGEPRWLAISSTNTGTASARPTQNRRVMSRNSWLGAASADTSTGSSAMPQIGQLPGPICRTSGCIGQVYVAPPFAGGAACGFKYRSGSAANLVRQPAPQKWYRVPP